MGKMERAEKDSSSFRSTTIKMYRFIIDFSGPKQVPYQIIGPIWYISQENEEMKQVMKYGVRKF